jgi:hypothetical protein
MNHAQVHHILAEIIQGGVVLETNLDEIDGSGKSLQHGFKNSCSVFLQADHVFAPSLRSLIARVVALSSSPEPRSLMHH